MATNKLSSFGWKDPWQTSNESKSCCYYACVFVSKCFQFGKETSFLLHLYLEKKKKSLSRVTNSFLWNEMQLFWCVWCFFFLCPLVCNLPTRQNIVYSNPARLLLKCFCRVCVSSMSVSLLFLHGWSSQHESKGECIILVRCRVASWGVALCEQIQLMSFRHRKIVRASSAG